MFHPKKKNTAAQETMPTGPPPWLALFHRYFSLVLIAEAAVILGLGYMFLVKKQVRAFGADRAVDVVYWENEFSRAEQNFSSVQKLVELYSSVSEKDKEKMRSILPDEPDIPILLSQMEALAERQNMLLLAIILEKEKDLKDPAGAEKKVKSPWKRIDLQLTFSGTDDYNQFKGVIEKLERNIRLIDIQSFEYNPENDQFIVLARAYFLNKNTD